MPLPAMIVDLPGLPATPNGLMEAAVGPLDMPVHMQTSGALVEQDACGDPRLYPTVCITPPYPAISYDPGDSMMQVFPFNVYASIVCGAMGQSFERATQRVRNRLQMAEARGVEQGFWGAGGGALGGVIQALNALSPVTILGVGPQSPVEAVSLLEQQMASTYGGVPLIHARPRMGAYLGSKGILTERNPARTHFGSTVVLGAGYAGTAPDGTAPTATDEWMYATGRVVIWRSEVVVPPPTQIMNRTTNQLGLHAMRTYAVGIECGVYAVQVTRA